MDFIERVVDVSPTRGTRAPALLLLAVSLGLAGHCLRPSESKAELPGSYLGAGTTPPSQTNDPSDLPTVGSSQRTAGAETEVHMAGEFEVADAMTISASGAGEIQSTVIAPGKAGCPTGRLLVSNDSISPPTSGVIQYRDLGSLDTHSSQFDAFQEWESQELQLAVDDDLVSLTNGDVLYVRRVRIKSTLAPNTPAWFDTTWANKVGSWGPGTRVGVAVWRSTDGGQSFHHIATIDPATLEDGSGALPQPNRDPDTHQLIFAAPWANGGTDGSLSMVDRSEDQRSDDQIYMTLGCSGNYVDKT